MNAVLPIMVKEVRHILRDRRSLVAAILLPILMLALFGFAISLDLREVRVGLIDRDRTSASRMLVADLSADGTVRILARPEREQELEDLIARGVINVGLVVPPGYAADLASGHAAPVQILVDGSEASFAAQAQGQMVARVRDATVRRITREVRTLGQKGPLPGLSTEPRVFFNEPLDSRWYIVPGLMGVIIMQLAALLTSQCVAREYERNTIEQILVSPVSGPALMMGKLIPYVGLGVLQVTLVTVLARLLFQLPIRGSLGLFALATFLFLTGSMALGQFLSAALKSQQVAMQVSMLVTILPSILLSGFIFPIENMPGWLRVLSHIVPTRYYTTICRGLFLKDVGLEVLLPDLLAMVVFAGVLILATISRFRRRLT